MAITTVNARYEGFIFDGQNSRTYGVYVTDVEVFGAPVRNVEMIQIPGRNGAYALDNGFYENIQVTYKCAMGCESQADFNAGISAFRNMLASRIGYKRLEDEINTDEYRMACFHGGISVPTLNKDTATFDVVFDCKPQRFLKSGESPRTIGGSVTNTQTESGSIVSIESDGGDAVTSLVAQINPVQAGSGDPSPTNVRPITGWTAVNVIVSPTTIASDGTTTTTALGRTVYGGTVDVVTGVLTVTHGYYLLDGSENWTAAETTSTYNNFKIYKSETFKSLGNGGNGVSNMAVYGRNYTDGKIIFRSAIGANSTALYFFVPKTMVADLAAWKSLLGTTNLQMTMELATPITYSLTAQQVELLTGQNHVWADTGDITITWGDDPNKLVNPTLYDSHPLLSFEASGAGTININSDTISVTNQPIGDIVLANVVKLNSGESVTWSDTSRYLTGDAIRIDSIPAIQTTVIMDSYSYANYTQYSGDDMDYLSTTSTSRGMVITHSIPTPPQYVAGTSKSDTYTATVTNKVKNKSTGTIVDCTINISVQIAFDGTNHITATNTVTTSIGTASTAVTINTVIVNSTKSSLNGTAYIDLDIGEAYAIDGVAVVSINDSVSIGAALPVLGVGSNTVSKTGSVANLKVTPRWWQL